MEFEFSNEVGDSIIDLIVEGSNSSVGSSDQVSHALRNPANSVPVITPMNTRGVVAYSPAGPSSSNYVGFRPSYKSKTCSVRIAKADVRRLSNGKVELEKLEQTFIDLTDDTANVNYVNTVIQKKWGKEYVLCTNDGLPIEDGFGTQGIIN